MREQNSKNLGAIDRFCRLWPSLPFLELAPCIAWYAFMRSGMWMSAVEVNGDAVTHLNYTVAFASFAALIVLIGFKGKLGRFALSRGAAIGAGIVWAAGTGILILTGPYYKVILLAAVGNPKWIFTLAGVMCGLGMAVIYLQSFMRYCVLPFRYAALYLCYSHLLAAFIYLAVQCSPGWAIADGAPAYALIAVFILLPLVATLFLTTRFDLSRWTKSGGDVPHGGYTPMAKMGKPLGFSRPTRGFSRRYAKLTLVFFLFTLVSSGISAGAVNAAPPSVLISQHTVLVLVRIPIIAAVAAAVVAVDADKINFSKLCIAAIAVLEACAIGGLAVPADNALWFSTTQTVSYLFELLVWSLILAVGGCHRSYSAHIVGIGLASFTIGGAAGTICATALAAVAPGVALNLMLAVVLLPAFLFIGERDLNALISIEADKRAPQSIEDVVGEKIIAGGKMRGAFKTRLHAYAKEHGLTERETETLGYLVAGRGDNQIAEAMGISYNTARTHVRNVYAKCGVHGRQELIDLIDASVR